MYKEVITISNIIDIYKIIRRNTRNKKKLEKFEDYFSLNISYIYDVLINNSYAGGKYNSFMIYKPKMRLIMSQNIIDKVINHFVSYHYLKPLLEPHFINFNVATRKNKGTSYGIRYMKKWFSILRNKPFYILKCDISKYFNSIDHDILKELLVKRINDVNILRIINIIIDSVPNCLPIGNMSSQILAIYYMSGLDHYIKESLKIKYYVRYMDDFILLHEDKTYLETCLDKIKDYLKKLKLELNKKTEITSSKHGVVFLGYHFLIVNESLAVKITSRNKNMINKKMRYLEKNNIDRFKIVKSSYRGYYQVQIKLIKMIKD